MIGYCSGYQSLGEFITRPPLCNNIQYITDAQHANRASGWQNDCFTNNLITSLAEISQG